MVHPSPRWPASCSSYPSIHNPHEQLFSEAVPQEWGGVGLGGEMRTDWQVGLRRCSKDVT